MIELLRASDAEPELALTLGQGCARFLMKEFAGLVLDGVDGGEVIELLEHLRTEGTAPLVFVLSAGVRGGSPARALALPGCTLCSSASLSKETLREWLQTLPRNGGESTWSTTISTLLRLKRPMLQSG